MADELPTVPEQVDEWPYEFDWKGSTYQIQRPSPGWLHERLDQHRGPGGGLQTAALVQDLYDQLVVPREGPENDTPDLRGANDDESWEYYNFIQTFVGTHFLRPLMQGNSGRG